MSYRDNDNDNVSDFNAVNAVNWCLPREKASFLTQLRFQTSSGYGNTDSYVSHRSQLS